MKKITILLLLFVFTFSTFAQPQRRVGPRTVKGPPPAPEVKTISFEDPLSNFAVKGTMPKEHIFAAVSSAKTAADMILEGDENSLGALIGVLMFTGFHIIDKNQKILFAPRWGANGTAFYDFELVGMLRGSQLGMASSISRFGNALAGDDEELQRLNLPKLIFEELKAARNSKDYANKFFAELIFELSRNNPLETPDAAITTLQLMLIERRFLGDLVEMYAETQQGSLFRRQPEVKFVNASYSSFNSFSLADSPCKEIEDIVKIMDYESKAGKISKLFGEDLKGPFKQFHENYFKRIADHAAVVNKVYSYLKLILANITIDADFDIPEKLPYIRTKSGSQTGEFEKILTLSLKRKKINSELINCAGKNLKILTGLNVSVPNDGPVKDVPVEWEDIDTSNKVKDSREYPVIIQNYPDRFVKRHQIKTDENGESKIKLIGNKQHRDLTNVGVVDYIRKLRMRVRVATEKMDLEKDLDKIFWGTVDIKSGGDKNIDLIDKGMEKVAERISGGKTIKVIEGVERVSNLEGVKGTFAGGVANLIITLIPEMASKMKLINFQKIIPIKDWMLCTDDNNWGGSVTYMREKNTPNFSLTEDAIITIVAKSEDEPKTGIPEAIYEVRGSRERKNDIQTVPDDCCEGEYSSQGGSSMEFSDTFKAPFNIQYHSTVTNFQLGFQFATPDINAKYNSYLKVLSTACPYDNDEGYDKTLDGKYSFSGKLDEKEYYKRYADDGGEHLVGETSYIDSDGATVTWVWDLTHCRPKKKP